MDPDHSRIVYANPHVIQRSEVDRNIFNGCVGYTWDFSQAKYDGPFRGKRASSYSVVVSHA